MKRQNLSGYIEVFLKAKSTESCIMRTSVSIPCVLYTRHKGKHNTPIIDNKSVNAVELEEGILAKHNKCLI